MFISRRKFTLLASSIIASTLITGCGGMGATPEELVAKQYRLSDGIGDKITLSNADVYIKNDAVNLANGNIIMDEEGSIWNAMRFNGKVFYVVKNENDNHMKLKNQDGKLIKDFGITSRSATYNYDGKMYIATTTVADAKIYGNVYSNLFQFDGTEPKLIKKSVTASGDFRVGLNTKAWVSKSEQEVYGHSRSRGYKWAFYDIMTAQQNNIKPSLLPEGGYSLFNQKQGYEYEFMIGFTGDTAIYIYDYKFNNQAGESQSKYIMEAQNLSNKKVAILLDNNQEKFSFLTNGKDVVFKKGNRIIDMRTLQPATIDNNFIPIELNDTQSNLGGGYNKLKYKEYSMQDIYLARGQGKNLF